MHKHYKVALPYFSEKDISWIKEKVGVVLRGQLSTGPFVHEFEKQFATFMGTKYAVCVNTCTSALEISLKVLGLKKGDEVIVPAETFIATGMAVTLNGGKVVFAEIDPTSFCLNLKEVKRRISKKTRGVILVHFGGYMSHETIEIQKFCRQKGLFLIEDAAHAHGSSIDGKMAGSIGDTGCFSFFSTKIMTTGEGGMLTTNSKKIYDFAVALRERGRALNSGKELYSFEWRSCRVPEISALLGLNQLSHLNESIRIRNKITSIYNKEFRKTDALTTLTVPSNVRNAYWKHITIINDKRIARKKLAEILKVRYRIDINWAYDPPLHLQPVYRKMYRLRKGFLPVTENIMERHFHLPLHVGISANDAKYIAESVLEAAEKIRG
ncbi:L-glutamine:2-deoxy-scyllo-inosose aminotransferase [bacterium BMS3Abin10]|nr:L-glutamine:2-deoxy-scyllo-inosose aminotransferase [bacterium BMS3Abin10]GBE39916.1 L-glutamine:2-deoxy-scyllo-inosose aminotransferase [bacterium BMS3Bbin08]